MRSCTRCESPIGEDDPTWKCCPKHTSQHGPDVMCTNCAWKLHPDWPPKMEGQVMIFSKYIRKPFRIEAMQITDDNLRQVADLIGDGKIRYKDNGSKYFVASTQMIRGVTRIEPGFWLTKMNDAFRVYKPAVFEKIFWPLTAERDAILEVLSNLEKEEEDDKTATV